MTESKMNKIENLKKIKLSWQAGTSQDTMNLTPKYPGLEFIFGLGSSGMTLFEYELVDKVEGQSVLIHLTKDGLQRFFEHLNPPLMDLFDVRNDIYLKVKIDAVTPAENREIIKAMAEVAAHGGTGCECGCGCGG
jgi:hypothetical protein